MQTKQGLKKTYQMFFYDAASQLDKVGGKVRYFHSELSTGIFALGKEFLKIKGALYPKPTVCPLPSAAAPGLNAKDKRYVGRETDN